MKLATIERDAKINVMGIYGKVRMPRKCPGRSGRQAVLERYRELKMARSVDNFASGAVADFHRWLAHGVMPPPHRIVTAAIALAHLQAPLPRSGFVLSARSGRSPRGLRSARPSTWLSYDPGLDFTSAGAVNLTAVPVALVLPQLNAET